MKLKKLITAIGSVFLAASMSISAFAAKSLGPDYSKDWQVYVDNSIDPDFDFTSVKSVIINMEVSSLGNGYHGGKVAVDSLNAGWNELSFGGSEVNADVLLEGLGAFSMEIPLKTGVDGKFTIMFSEVSNKVFVVDNILFLDAKGWKLGEYDGDIFIGYKEEETTAEETTVIETTPEQTTPEETTTEEAGKPGQNTGDNAPVGFFTGMLIGSFFVIILSLIYYKSKKDEEMDTQE